MLWKRSEYVPKKNHLNPWKRAAALCLSVTLVPVQYPQHLENFLSSGTHRIHTQRCQHLPLLL